MTPRGLINIHTTGNSCRDALACANMALKLLRHFYLLMEKPLSHYFQVWSPYYQAVQCNQKTPIPVKDEKIILFKYCCRQKSFSKLARHVINNSFAKKNDKISTTRATLKTKKKNYACLLMQKNLRSRSIFVEKSIVRSGYIEY